MTLIKFISAEDTLPIRNEILRNGKLSLDECRFTGDVDEGSFNLGLFVEGKLVSIVSFHKRNHVDYYGKGYQLLGMATLNEHRGKGYGNKLINFAVVFLKRQKVEYVWCNARKITYHFYFRLNFKFISDEHEIPGVGPHRNMFLKIQ